MTHADAYRNDPVVAAAIAAAGLDVDDLPWEGEDGGDGDSRGVVRSGPAGRQRSLLLREGGSAAVWWCAADETRVRYELDDEGGIVTIEDHRMPETMLAAIGGRPLSDVVDVPGADRMRILVAVVSRAFVSDPLDTRMSVEPIRREDR